MMQFTLVGCNHMNCFNAFYTKALFMLSKLLFKLKKRKKFAMKTNIINNTMTQIL